jgi:hypothetical protein
VTSAIGRTALCCLLLIFAIRPPSSSMARRLGLDRLFRSRLQFLALGLILSGLGTDIWSQALVLRLDALVTLGLGVLGLLLGLSIGGTAPINRRLAAAAGVETILTLVLVSIPFFFALEIVMPLAWQQRAMAAALIGCAASISGRRLFSRRRLAPEPPFGHLNQIADLGTAAGVLAAGMLLALLTPAPGLSPLERVLVLAVIGIVGGLGAWLLASDTPRGSLRTALLIGVLLITAGTATHLSLPPIAATLIMGLTIANLPGPLASELRSSIDFLESPLRALLLVMAGAALPALTWVMATLVVLFLALRTPGKILGGKLASIAACGLVPERMGLGLLPSSAVAVGLALDFQATAPPAIAGAVVASAVLGSVLSETAGLFTTEALARAHVLSDAVVEAAAPDLAAQEGSA